TEGMSGKMEQFLADQLEAGRVLDATIAHTFGQSRNMWRIREADGAGEGLADAAGAGLAVCARAPDSPCDKAAAGISAAKARRRKVFILFSPRPASSGPQFIKALPTKALTRPRVPVRAKPRRSNTREPNSSHDRCVMAGTLPDVPARAANHWPSGRGSPYKAGEIREFS
ncbi:hypothetical protein, partial [Bradyrhizobium yuanmingense]|uniref:hypothetical protein n=1 Tax=Bradyrhizobium yuanmingense TaxID=108015 RepID=UPI002A3AA541|nr:hypothetical protein [Bradyrhizobium yuanmingense]